MLIYLGLTMMGPNGLRTGLVWPVVSQHVLQARAWLGDDIEIPGPDGTVIDVVAVAPRLDVTPYFRHRVVADPREDGLVSNLAVVVRDGAGRAIPAQSVVAVGADPDAAIESAECYVGFPPGPAVVLAPWGLILGEALATQWLAALLGGIAVAAMTSLRRSWARRQGSTRLSDPAFGLLAGAGTLWIWMVPDGGTFLFAQTVGTTAAVAALALAASRRPGLAGLAFGLAIISRPATIGTAPFLLVLLLDGSRSVAEAAAPVFRAALGPAFAGAAALAHNLARFGDPWEFGYRFMILPPFLAERIAEHGSLSLAFLAHNAWTVLLSPPALVVGDAGRMAFPFLASSREGMGLIFVSPAVAAGALIGALLIRRQGVAGWSLVLSLGLTLLPGLLYYNSGWVQWGGRFLMDAWPLWLLLAWEGLHRLPLRWSLTLIVLSVASNLWAVLLTWTGLWPACVP
jgi:hypothetical protein